MDVVRGAGRDGVVCGGLVELKSRRPSVAGARERPAGHQCGSFPWFGSFNQERRAGPASDGDRDCDGGRGVYGLWRTASASASRKGGKAYNKLRCAQGVRPPSAHLMPDVTGAATSRPDLPSPRHKFHLPACRLRKRNGRRPLFGRVTKWKPHKNGSLKDV